MMTMPRHKSPSGWLISAITAVFLSAMAVAPWPAGAQPTAAATSPSTAAAADLAQRINAYRSSVGLPSVPLSPSLTRVAEAHVRDLVAHPPNRPQCNLHSWSEAASPATPCCYSRDHSQAQCMWKKPSEITAGVYGATGFEIAYWSSEPATAEGALDGWKISPGHNAVLTNQGSWKAMTWRAMGVAVMDGYAVAWFGTDPDPASR